MILFVNCGNQELEIHDNNTTYLKDCPIWVDAVQTVAVNYHKLPVRGNKRRAQAMLEEYKNSFAIPEPEAENPEINLDMCGVDLGDGIGLINTQEDMYLYALLELYKLFCKLS
ncbi:MAG: hypothetical protein MJ153_08715 [Clostridia bacterium]|nr:hypothetical protein [Clostridia bacterium]